MSNVATTTIQTGALEPRSGSNALQRMFSALSQNKRFQASYTGERHVWDSFRMLNSAHPLIVQTLMTWPDQNKAEKVVRTFRCFLCNNRTRKHRNVTSNASKWNLAKRLKPEEFVKFYILDSPRGLTPAVNNLPDQMLSSIKDLRDVESYFIYVGGKYRAKPSAFFPGISPHINAKVIACGLESHVDFLIQLAACTQGDSQYGFLDRWVKSSPAAATQWASVSEWKVPLIHECDCKGDKPCSVDPEAHEIWDAFFYFRTSHLKTFGPFYQHFALKAFKHQQRWYDVFWKFGSMLEHGEDVSDLSPPWNTK